MSDSENARKRNRLSLVCTVCKKRKVKCDQGRPCSACVKYNKGINCEYSKPSWSNTHVSNDPRNSGINGTNTSTSYPEVGVQPVALIPPLSTPKPMIAAAPQYTSFEIGPRFLPGLKSMPSQFAPSPMSTITAPSPASSDVHSELDGIKQRIHHLESSVNVAGSPQRHPYGAEFKIPSTPNAPNGRMFNESHPLPGRFQHPMGVPPRTPFNGASSEDPLKTPMPSTVPDHKRLMWSMYGSNPIQSDNDEINFYDGYAPVHIGDSRTMNHGPLSWITILKRDPALYMLCHYVASDREKKKVIIISHVERDRPKTFNFSRKNFQYGFKGVPLSLSTASYEPELNKEIQLNVLPKQRVIWLLVDRFFRKVYPLFPFIDEVEFVESVSGLIGPRGYRDETIQGVKMKKKADLLSFGLLLVVLRITFLAMISNNPSINEYAKYNEDVSDEAANIRYLLNNPVSTDVVDTAHACLNRFNLVKKTTFPLLQCALFMKLYQIIAPEDADGSDGGDFQVFTGILIQMANSIGLNRDPSHYMDIFPNEKVANLWRKVWYQMVTFDIIQGALIGNPLSIFPQYFDTKLPLLLNKEDSVESLIAQHYTELEVAFGKVRSILTHVLGINEPVKLKLLSEKVSDLETFLVNRYKCLDDILNVPASLPPAIHANKENINTMKTFRLRIYLHLKLFLLTLNYYFFLYYEEKSNVDLAFFYLKKVLVISLVDLLPNISKLLLFNRDYIGEGRDIFITPILEMAFQKSTQMNLASIIRAKIFLYSSGYDVNKTQTPGVNGRPTQISKVEHLASSFVKVTEKYIANMSKISHRYYYTWRVTKAKSHVLSLIQQEDFYSHSPDVSLNNFRYRNTKQLNRTNIFKFLSFDQLDQLEAVINFGCTGELTVPAEVSGLYRDVSQQNTPMGEVNQNPQQQQPVPEQQQPQQPPQDDNDLLSIINNKEIDKIWLSVISNKANYNALENSNGYGNNGSNVPETSGTGVGTSSSAEAAKTGPNQQPDDNGDAIAGDFNGFNLSLDGTSDYFVDPFDIFVDLNFDSVY